MKKTFSIIIIDNDASQAELIELQLRKASISFSQVRVGSKEMFLATVRDAKPDLVIASTTVPKFDMLAALGEAKKVVPGVPWIMVGASGNEEVAVSMMKAGASDFVGKKNIARIGPAAKGLLEQRQESREEPSLLTELDDAAPGKEEDSLFRQLAESAPDLIAVINKEGRRLYNNPAYNDILDEPETLAGTDSFVDIHPEDRERIRRGFQETIGTGVGLQTEYRLMDKEGNTRYIESHSSVIADEEGEPEKVVVISRDVTERVLNQKGLEELIAGTAGVAGEQFFPALVRHVALALGTRYALVSEVVGDGRDRVRSIAYWADGALQPVFEYDVADTTCEHVVKDGETSCYMDGVQNMFPKETALAAMHAESYLGTPLLGSAGRPIGHLFVMDHQPMEDIPRKESILKVFAQRAALELERIGRPEESKRRESSWKTMEARFRSGLEGMNAALVMTDENDLITLVSGKLEELTGYRSPELVGRRPWPLILGTGAWDLLKEEYQDTLLRNDKSTRPVTVYAVPCRNTEGRISGTLALLRTEERAETVPLPAAPAGEQLALLDRIGVALIVRDLEDRIIFWNAGAQQLYGWTSADAFGKTVTALLYGQDAAAASGATAATLARGMWTGEVRQTTKDGREVVVESRWTLVRDSGGTPRSILIMNSNVTGRGEEQPPPGRSAMLVGISSVADGIARELDDLLAPIMLASDSLSAKAVDDQTRRLVEVIGRKARRATEMAKQVIAYTTGIDERQDNTADLPDGNGEQVLIVQADAAIRALYRVTLDAHGYRALCPSEPAEAIELLADAQNDIRAVLVDPSAVLGDGTPVEIKVRGMQNRCPIIATGTVDPEGKNVDSSRFAAIIPRSHQARTLLETLAKVLGKS